MTLPGGEDWVLSPVLAGLCKYESLIDGTMSLADVALLNDALLVRSDNQDIARRRMEKNHG
ncbi:MAG: hypothetical protein KKD25_01880 [Gammaproteobacteria bacterium]|nr:hypothetical protein [Gammaproteobacteria bacterium]MBU0771797.1 hypothetical protein [Gammaproteobacteria bacterium]MBU0855553.1 hypothetical protein [Gammaproteobacteria bacterium]MBU1846115.1 hypothetical protein [Gammaproteobacteria bacterium]